MKSTQLPRLHCLIGDSLENLYQLGLNDREGHEMLLNHAFSIIGGRRHALNKGLQGILKMGVRPLLDLNPSYKEKIEAYASGLGIPPQELALGLFIPELMCAMDKWMPGVPHYLLGCSSYFTWDEERDAPLHGRILDFPFLGSFDENERIIQSQLDSGPVTLSFSSSGFPFPTITAMTSAGFGLSLHQKFGSTFDYGGTPIFEILFELLQNCETKDDCIRYLKNQRSLTSWGIYLSFPNGEVLSWEMNGEEFCYNQHQIEPGKLLFFCNQREDLSMENKEVLPYGFTAYNKMRLDMQSKKSTKFTKAIKNKWSAEKLLRYMGTADEQRKVKSTQWQADPMTPATLQNIVMIPKTGEALFIPGSAPKFFNGEVGHLKGAFEKAELSLASVRGKANDKFYQKGVTHYMQAQVAQDLKNPHQVYHHLQMAIEYFENNPYQVIAKFFFHVFQYMYEDHNKVLSQLLLDFKSLEEKLPSYLKDHCLLFIARLEKILKGKTSIGIDEIHHPSLQKIFEFETKMPRLLFHNTTREFMAPRLELLEILYPHVKA